MKFDLLYFIFFIVILPSCTLSKNSFDRQNLKKIEKNRASIPDLADLSISLMGDKNWLEVHTDTLTSIPLRTKFKKLGDFSSVYVNNKDTFSYGHNEPIDSTVTFKRWKFFLGIGEIIYDFSKRDRSFPDYISTTGDYKFLSLGGRIYYRRRPIPWM